MYYALPLPARSYVNERVSLCFLDNPEWEIDSARIYCEGPISRRAAAPRRVSYYTLLPITRYYANNNDVTVHNDIIIYASKHRAQRISSYVNPAGEYRPRGARCIILPSLPRVCLCVRGTTMSSTVRAFKRLNVRIIHASLSKVPPQAGFRKLTINRLSDLQGANIVR